MTEKFISKISAIRSDLIRGATLLFLAVLIWCTIYNRWTISSWQTPITYISDLSKGDVLFQFAIIKATSDGHLLPVVATHVPELGAPYGADWDDFPVPEKPLHWMMGFFAKFMGIFMAANFAAMLEVVLATLSFYTACRLLKTSWPWAFSGALVFAFARFGFAHGIHHLPTAYIWHVPLCVVAGMWMIRDGIQFRTARFTFALAVAFCTGVQNPYNTNMFAQFILIGALVQWWRGRGWRVWLPAFAIVGTAAAGFLIMNMNTFVYQFSHGPNPGAVVRSYRWLEIYGLKFVDLIIPPPDHRFGPFAAWGSGHMNPNEIVLSPGELPPTAYIGILGVAAFVWLLIFSLRRVVEGARPPLEACMILWILLYSDVGGVNGLIGTLGFQLFRATTRYSIWVLCVVLLFAVKRLSSTDFKKIARLLGGELMAPWLGCSAAFMCVVLALLDQTPPVVSRAELQADQAAVASDRNFAEKMEQNLAPDSMVFQIPIMDFPESPAPNIGSYEHFRPYLYSHHLRYSFGTDKGRRREDWQHELGHLPLNEFIGKIENYGFGALYINRKAFPDGGDGIVKSLKDMGFEQGIVSDTGDLLCIFLKPAPHPIKPITYE